VSSWVADDGMEFSEDVNRLDGALMMLGALVCVHYIAVFRGFRGELELNEYLRTVCHCYFGIFEFLIHGDTP